MARAATSAEIGSNINSSDSGGLGSIYSNLFDNRPLAYPDCQLTHKPASILHSRPFWRRAHR